MNNLNVTIHRHNMKYANDEILTIATAFITNEPRYGGDSGNMTIYKTQYYARSMVNGGFYDDQ